jgi:hypothetical protein
MLRPVAAELDLSADPDAAMLKALASEFAEMRSTVQDVERMEWVGEQMSPELQRLVRLFVRRPPLFRPHKALNKAGSYMEQVAASLDTYRRRRPVEEVFGGPWLNPGPLCLSLNFADELAITQLLSVDWLIADHYKLQTAARLTQLFLALRCYQLEHGKLPGKLDELAPEYLKTIPLDPFTGKPFGYEPGGQKPRIWSVGPDQRTDPPDAEHGDDVVVEVQFAPPPAGMP